MNTRTWAAALLITVCTTLYGCGQETPAPTATATPPAELSISIPTPTATATPWPTAAPLLYQPPSIGAPPPYYGVQTLAEAVLGADIIARVQLLSRATSTVSETWGEPGDQTTVWVPLVDFTFTVHEYLKGSGATTITASITGESQDTQELAAAETAHLLSHHDSQWDNRQAIVFLRTYPLLGTKYWLGYGDEFWPGDTPGYQVSSRHERNWLPEATNTSGARGATAEPSFMLSAPSTTSGSQRSTTGGDGGDTISLSALKARIGELETEANAGGTDEYRACIEIYYRRHPFLSARLAQGRLGTIGQVGPVMSGQPAGIFLREHWSYAYGRTLDDDSEPNIGRHWFEGTDPGVVKYRAARFWLDEDGKARVMNQLVTARPLPAGDYQFFYNSLPPFVLVCGKSSPLEKNNNDYRLSVTRSSDRTVHEAFFDPVDIGTAVGSDGANGVLEPSAFSLDGTTTTITSLKWEDGAVTMALSPRRLRLRITPSTS